MIKLAGPRKFRTVRAYCPHCTFTPGVTVIINELAIKSVFTYTVIHESQNQYSRSLHDPTCTLQLIHITKTTNEIFLSSHQ